MCKSELYSIPKNGLVTVCGLGIVQFIGLSTFNWEEKMFATLFWCKFISLENRDFDPLFFFAIMHFYMQQNLLVLNLNQNLSLKGIVHFEINF